MITDDLRKQLDELGQTHWEGKQNYFIRYWVYLDNGLEVFNKFKYYIGFPLAAGALLPFLEGKFAWLVGLTILGLPILIVVGRYKLQKVDKTMQYVQTISGNLFQFKPMELSLEQVDLLKDIRDKLNENLIHRNKS